MSASVVTIIGPATPSDPILLQSMMRPDAVSRRINMLDKTKS